MFQQKIWRKSLYQEKTLDVIPVGVNGKLFFGMVRDFVVVAIDLLNYAFVKVNI
jgi:hypothetical protein